MMRFVLLFGIIALCNIGLAQTDNRASPVLPDLMLEFPNVRDFTISAEEDEAYFTALSPLGELSFIIRLRKEGNDWFSEIASFSGKHTDLEPFLSQDGLRLFFASNRPKSVGSTSTDFDIWYVERENISSPWSEAINAGPAVNTEDSEFYPAITNSGNLYFTCSKKGSTSQDDIYLSKWNGNGYEKPISLGAGVNSNGYEFNAYVSPDESFIIFSGFGRPDGLGQGDLYISKRGANGIWGKAENLGKGANSNKLDYCPFVNTKTNTLYFTSKRSKVSLQNGGFENIHQFLREVNQYENGMSRIYRTTLKR